MHAHVCLAWTVQVYARTVQAHARTVQAHARTVQAHARTGQRQMCTFPWQVTDAARLEPAIAAAKRAGAAEWLIERAEAAMQAVR